MAGKKTREKTTRQNEWSERSLLWMNFTSGWILCSNLARSLSLSRVCVHKTSMWFKVVCFCSCSKILVCFQVGYRIVYVHLPIAMVRYALLIYFLWFLFWHLTKSTQQSQAQFKFTFLSARFFQFVCGTVIFNTESFVCLLCYVLFFASLHLSAHFGSIFRHNNKSLKQCSITSQRVECTFCLFLSVAPK